MAELELTGFINQLIHTYTYITAGHHPVVMVGHRVYQFTASFFPLHTMRNGWMEFDDSNVDDLSTYIIYIYIYQLQLGIIDRSFVFQGGNGLEMFGDYQHYQTNNYCIVSDQAKSDKILGVSFGSCCRYGMCKWNVTHIIETHIHINIIHFCV